MKKPSKHQYQPKYLYIIHQNYYHFKLNAKKEKNNLELLLDYIFYSSGSEYLDSKVWNPDVNALQFHSETLKNDIKKLTNLKNKN